MKKQKNKSLHIKEFRICLSQQELNVLLKVLFQEVSYLKRNQSQGVMAFQGKQYYMESLSLIRLYTEPTLKQRKMYKHTIEKLNVLLGMLEVHLFDTLKDDFSIKLYERLTKIYEKRKKDYLSIAHK